MFPFLKRVGGDEDSLLVDNTPHTEKQTNQKIMTLLHQKKYTYKSSSWFPEQHHISTFCPIKMFPRFFDPALCELSVDGLKSLVRSVFTTLAFHML